MRAASISEGIAWYGAARHRAGSSVWHSGAAAARSAKTASSVLALASTGGVTPGSISGRAALALPRVHRDQQRHHRVLPAAGVEIVQVQRGVLGGLAVPRGVAQAGAHRAGHDGVRH